jgi:type IV pilus assembly protein PilQ
MLDCDWSSDVCSSDLGIYTRNTGRQVDQIPFFGDIPILGVLFQRRRVRDERNELLIFLTPRIVNRAEALRH